MRPPNGKINRLPLEIREGIQHRLHEHVPGVEILEWLNGLPEVKKLTNKYFNGRPINSGNLSEWKHYQPSRGKETKRLLTQADFPYLVKAFRVYEETVARTGSANGVIAPIVRFMFQHLPHLAPSVASLDEKFKRYYKAWVSGGRKLSALTGPKGGSENKMMVAARFDAATREIKKYATKQTNKRTDTSL